MISHLLIIYIILYNKLFAILFKCFSYNVIAVLQFITSGVMLDILCMFAVAAFLLSSE